MKSPTPSNGVNAIKDARKLFNERRSNISREETKGIIKKLHRKETIYNFLKEKDQEGSLTNKQKQELKNTDRYLKNLKKDLEKQHKYKYNTTHDKDSKLTLYEYFDIIRPYLKDMIDNHKARGEWKIQLIMRIIFVSFVDSNETHVMHTKSDNIEIMSGIETSDVINELFISFIKRYQEGNPKNTEDNNCFQYAITAALNHQNIDHHPERISKLRLFINNYNWRDTEFPSRSKDCRTFEQNNKTIALNILYVSYNTKQIKQVYISKYNNEHDNQVNLLMITDGTNNWHYLAVKSISGLLRKVTSNANSNFYCLNCFYPYTTEIKLRKHEKICNDHDFRHLKMPDEDNKILKYVPGEKSLRVPFIIYADFTSKNKYMSE